MTNNAPFHAYLGQEPFAFVSYAHLDMSVVYPIIQRLDNLGARIWYDEGIEPGQDWPETLARTIERCELVIAFLSTAFSGSINCANEIGRAIESGKHILPIHLEAAVLQQNLTPEVGSIQAILKHELSEVQFESTLHDALSRHTPSILGKNFGAYRFDSVRALRAWLAQHCQRDYYILSTGYEGYGSDVHLAAEGKISARFRRTDIDDLLETAERRPRKYAHRDALVNVEDRLGSPGYPEYQWWEHNVKQYRGEAAIYVDITPELAALSFVLPEHFRHEWSGW